MRSGVTPKALCKPYKAAQVRAVTLTVIRWPQVRAHKKGLEAEHANRDAAE